MDKITSLLNDAIALAIEYQRLERLCVQEAADAPSGDAMIHATEAARLLARAALDKIALAKQLLEIKESHISAEEKTKEIELIEKKVKEIIGLKYK